MNQHPHPVLHPTIVLTATLLLGGCARFQHQTTALEPHAVVTVAKPPGPSKDESVVKRLDGLPVIQGRDYRVTPGQHTVVVKSIALVPEKVQSGVSMRIHDPNVNPKDPFRPSAVSPETETRAHSTVVYTTNTITVQAGGRYILDGQTISPR